MNLKDTHVTYVHPNLRHLVDRFRVKARERGQRMEEKTAREVVQFLLFSFVRYNKLHRKAERADGVLDLGGKAQMNLSSEILRDVLNELGLDYKAEGRFRGRGWDDARAQGLS